MALSLDPSATAFIPIDIQHGALAFPLTPHDAPTLVVSAARLGRAIADVGGLIATVRIAFSPDLGDRLRQPTDIPMMLPEGGFPEGWSDLAPEIAALPAAVSVTKRHWSAFHGAELDLQLRRRGIRTIVLCGVATNFGVESTARDAWQLGYEVVIAEDACSSIGEGAHAFAISTTLPRVSRVRTVEEIVAALG